jgi:hypothetical protein
MLPSVIPWSGCESSARSIDLAVSQVSLTAWFAGITVTAFAWTVPPSELLDDWAG